MTTDYSEIMQLLDAEIFARHQLGFVPDPHQARILASEERRGLLNCTRQWGKSTVAAVKALHHAFRQRSCLVLVVSPSLRQSGEFVRKAASSCGISTSTLASTGSTRSPSSSRTGRGSSGCRRKRTTSAVSRGPAWS